MTPSYEMTLYLSDVREKKSNTSYPYEAHITGIAELAKAAQFDHVSAKYADGTNSRGNAVKAHRSKKTFIEADNINMDCDNKENNPMLPDIPPEKWQTPKTVQAAFPGVAFYAVPSRNHMKEKNGLHPRPKYHYYFPLAEKITDGKKWAALKRNVQAYFPAFDDGAIDAARFLFGVEAPEPVFVPGEICIDAFMEQKAAERREQEKKASQIIPEGKRNTTMSHFAGIVLKKYGDADGKAEKAFLDEAEKCSPALEPSELSTIWNSALGFYRQTVKTDPSYLSPAEYAAEVFKQTLEPADYTDIGQANLFAAVYGDKVKYTPATKFIVHDGKVWQESETQAQGLAQELTERQLTEARRRMARARKALDRATEENNEDKMREAKNQLEDEKRFYAYVISCRKSNKIKATLTETRPKVEIHVSELDADGYLLNRPGGTVDLKTGEMKKHDPKDYCTNMTAVTRGTAGREIFSDFMERVTVGDKALAMYLQEVAGMCAIGRVLRENLIIAYGEGGNGKSTLFNLLAHVLGGYSGALSAETLTANCRKNKSPEYAELRGKRLVIAAELEEGMRLDTAIVKKLCSTDPILAEKKYKDPFTFVPSHTVILYTNHLPKIGTTDKGTWDRIIAVPFLANFRGIKGEIKNYADYLFEKCGGAVLSWIIEGAKRFIANGYNIDLPQCVKGAIERYRANNDWLENFLAECCEVQPYYKQRSGELYDRYRMYSDHTGDYRRSLADFKQALNMAGHETHKTKYGAFVHGLKVKPDTSEFEPLPPDFIGGDDG